MILNDIIYLKHKIFISIFNTLRFLVHYHWTKITENIYFPKYDKYEIDILKNIKKYDWRVALLYLQF